MALSQEQKSFIEKVGKLAAADALKSGVLASLTIAQAILESGWGKSGLTVKANALFGIKAGTTWKGKVYNSQTQECYDGVSMTTITAAFRAYNSWEESVADHSALLTGAARYKAVVGEKDYKKACVEIKAAGYATDPAYSDKLISIIETYALTTYDKAQGKGEIKLNIIQSMITNNDCYKNNVKKADSRYTTFQSRGPLGLMLHSVGCPQPSAKVFVNTWNQPGKEVACHGLIEPNGDIFQCMPWNYRGWHGASGAKGCVNDTHIGFEMTEPASIKYTSGANFVDNDPAKTKVHVLGTYKTAVDFFAYLCGLLKLDPLKDGVIISHSEGCKRGIASNHGDVEHLWGKFGLTMNQFRQDVKNAMGGTVTASATPATPTTPTAFTPYTVKVTADTLNIRKGPGTGYGTNGAIKDKGVYTIVEEASGTGAKLWGKLKSGAGWISLDYTVKR